MRDILLEEARLHQVTPADLIAYNRTPMLLPIRWRVYWRMRNEKGASYPQIGQIMNRTHSAVIHGVRRYDSLRAAGLCN